MLSNLRAILANAQIVKGNDEGTTELMPSFIVWE
jgi:hypothetical protein